VVVTGLYKLSPLYAFDEDTFNDHKAPGQILDYSTGMLFCIIFLFFMFVLDTFESVSVQNPAFDYVPPELVDLYLTNMYVLIWYARVFDFFW